MEYYCFLNIYIERDKHFLKEPWLRKFRDYNSYKLFLEIYNAYMRTKYSTKRGKNRFVLNRNFPEQKKLILKMPVNFSKSTHEKHCTIIFILILADSGIVLSFTIVTSITMKYLIITLSGK